MRQIRRLDLPAATQRALQRKQAEADTKRAAGTLNVEVTWKSARQTRPLKTALRVLQEMAGNRQRCMYCGDSHGTDIEHFWPKRQYPNQLFFWLNLLFCCTECGRFKGEQFPLKNGRPLLVDPTKDDPWEFLDFDPTTGNIVARYNPAMHDWVDKGIATVKALHLDCREALAAGYRRTYQRLKSIVETALQQPLLNPDELARALREADDHGLVGWCFQGTGQNEAPFKSLRNDHPDAWERCINYTY